MSKSDAIYQDLTNLLSQRKNEVLQIEILPPGLGPLLHDGSSIGLHKKALVQAFVTARNIFFEKLSRLDKEEMIATFFLENELRGTPKASLDSPADLAIATEVVLLFDCEHITACNWRKRRLSLLIRNIGNDSQRQTKYNESFVQEMLEKECSLVSTFLTSPLHRHTKSPTLWQHRLWVVDKLCNLSVSTRGRSRDNSESSQQIATSLSTYLQAKILEELTVVLRSGEKHPNNYYAFAYMRQLHHTMTVVGGDTEDPNQNRLFAPLAGCLVDPTLSWCLAHPRDISGWMFLLYAIDSFSQVARQKSVVEKVVNFALNIGWEGESLWTFIAFAVRKFGTEVLKSSLCGMEEPFRDMTEGPWVNEEAGIPPRYWKRYAAAVRNFATNEPDRSQKFRTDRRD